MTELFYVVEKTYSTDEQEGPLFIACAPEFDCPCCDAPVTASDYDKDAAIQRLAEYVKGFAKQRSITNLKELVVTMDYTDEDMSDVIEHGLVPITAVAAPNT